MEQSARCGLSTARIMIAVVFLLNAFGIIDQSIPARELVERGAPPSLVQMIMLSGRALELIAGFALAFGTAPDELFFGPVHRPSPANGILLNHINLPTFYRCL